MYNIDVPILDEKVTLRPWLPALVLLSGWNWLEPPRHPSRNVSTAIPFSAFASLPPLGKLFDEHTRSSIFFKRRYKSVFFLVNIKSPPYVYSWNPLIRCHVRQMPHGMMTKSIMKLSCLSVIIMHLYLLNSRQNFTSQFLGTDGTNRTNQTDGTDKTDRTDKTDI